HPRRADGNDRSQEAFMNNSRPDALRRFDEPATQPESAAGPIDDACIWRALTTVVDPEIGLDIVTLGLIYDVALEGTTVRVTFTLTTPGCPMSNVITAGIEGAV